MTYNKSLHWPSASINHGFRTWLYLQLQQPHQILEPVS